MLNLKQNNERLQRLVTSKSLTSSQSSLPSDPDRRFSMTEVASTVAALSNGGDTGTTADQLEDLNVPEHTVVASNTSTVGEPTLEQDTDGKRINVAIYLGSEKNFNYNLVTGSTSDGSMGEPPHCVIANVCISNKTTWDSLDSTVRRCFKEYVSRVDPVTNLGLGVECVAAYHLGEASKYLIWNCYCRGDFLIVFMNVLLIFQMHDGLAASRTASLRLSDWPREDHLFGAFRLLLARRGHSNTAVYCAAIDISADRASSGYSMRAEWYRQELSGRKIGSCLGRCGQRYEGCDRGRYVQR